MCPSLVSLTNVSIYKGYLRTYKATIISARGVHLAKKTIEPTLDVLSHILVPAMKVLSHSETEKVLKQYSISKDQLAKVKSSDPAIVALKANVGDVISIQRKDETGTYPGYRIVVN